MSKTVSCSVPCSAVDFNHHAPLNDYSHLGMVSGDCETTKKAPVDLRPATESLGSELSIAEEFCGWSMKREKSYAHSTPGGPGG